MGLLGTMSAAGTALGPSLGGAMLTYPGWRAVFLINAPLGLVALWLAGDLHARERRSARVPFFPPSLFTDGALAASLLSNGLVACVMMSTLIVGPFYLTRALQLSPATMGLVMTVGPVLTALAGVPGGRLVDARGPRIAVLTGLASMAAGSALLAVVPRPLGVAGYLAPIAFLTVGYAVFQSGNNTAVLRNATGDERGVVAGVLSLARNLGLVAGSSLAGAVFALSVGASKISAASPDAVARGMHATFGLATGLVSIAFILAASRRVTVPAPAPLTS
jgi:MFS family permease